MSAFGVGGCPAWSAQPGTAEGTRSPASSTPVLSATESAGPKAEYLLGEKLQAEVAQQAADLLAPDPLRASVDLSA